MRVHAARTGSCALWCGRRARLCGHLPRRDCSRPQRTRAARAGGRGDDRVRRSAAGSAAAGSCTRCRRLRHPPRRRSLRLSACRRRRRRATGYNDDRARRGPACVNAAPDFPPAIAGRAHARVPARAGCAQPRRRKVVEADACATVAGRSRAHAARGVAFPRPADARRAPGLGGEFIAWAVRTWSRARLPPVPMLLAPLR